MISIFKKNDVLNIILLLPYAVLLRLHSIIYPKTYTITEADSYLSAWLLSLIEQPLIQGTIAIVLVFGQAIAINVLINNHRLYRAPSALAGMIYILLVSCIPQLQYLSPALIGATFIIISIYHVFSTYKLNAATLHIFNAALTSCLAAFIYPPYFIFIIGIFIGFATMRNFKFLERLQFLIGYITVVWILSAFFFFIGKLDNHLYNFIGFPGAIFDFSLLLSQENLILSGYIFLTLLVLVSYYNYVKKKGIDVRKKIAFFYWMMVCSLLPIFFFYGIGFHHFIFLAIPLSFFLSMSLLLIKNTFLVEVFHLCVIAGLMYYQFIGITV